MNRDVIRFAAVALMSGATVLAQQAATPSAKSALNLNDAHAEMRQALSFLKAGQSKKAGVPLDRALQILGTTPRAAYAHYLRAKVYTAQGETSMAVAQLEEAVALEPDYPAAWSDLGRARETLSDDTGALAAFKRAVGLDPKDAIAQYRLGAEYLHRGNAQLAIQPLKQALSLNPDGQSALYSLQRALQETGRSAEAGKVRQKLADVLHRRDVLYQRTLKAVAINNQGTALQKSGNLQGALEKYRAALKLSPGQIGIRVNFAIALLRLGHWSHGLSELHEAIQKDPGDNLLRRAWNDAVSQAPAGTLVNGVPVQPLVARQGYQ